MKTIQLLLSGLMASLLLSGCGIGAGKEADGRVEIEFFQSKSEAKDIFNKLIDKFNSEQSEIRVTQVNPPDAETILKTRVVKNDEPDVLGIGAGDTFRVLSQSGIFIDFSGNPLLQSINPTYVKQLTDITAVDKVTGIPFATNAAGVIYNKTLFKQMGLSAPKTWDELIAVAEKINQAGKIPFYHTYKDAWTTLIPFNSLASNLAGIDFLLKRREGRTTFSAAYPEVADKLLELLNYGHRDNFGKTYADGNQAMARGDAYMYLQGIWAIPEIKKANPDIDLGFFPLPVSNDPDKNRMVSGVDTLLTISEDSKHVNEAQAFIAFLLRPDNVAAYLENQTLFTAVKDINQKAPSVAESLPYIKQGKLVDFSDHYIPASVQLDAIIQGFLLHGNAGDFLSMLDRQWDKVTERM